MTVVASNICGGETSSPITFCASQVLRSQGQITRQLDPSLQIAILRNTSPAPSSQQHAAQNAAQKLVQSSHHVHASSLSSLFLPYIQHIGACKTPLKPTGFVIISGDPEGGTSAEVWSPQKQCWLPPPSRNMFSPTVDALGQRVTACDGAACFELRKKPDGEITSFWLGQAFLIPPSWFREKEMGTKLGLFWVSPSTLAVSFIVCFKLMKQATCWQEGQKSDLSNFLATSDRF